jgi:hypothetical protein
MPTISLNSRRAGFNNQIGNEMKKFVTIDTPGNGRVLNYRKIIDEYVAGDKVEIIALQNKCTGSAVCIIIKRYAPHLMRGSGNRAQSQWVITPNPLLPKDFCQ